MYVYKNIENDLKILFNIFKLKIVNFQSNQQYLINLYQVL